jgi:hypothetical protein
MAILKPVNISPSNISVDATQEIVVSWKNYGDRQYAYQVKIYKNIDNSLILDSGKIISFNNFHVINANTLTNGIQYKYQITVWNQINETATSDWILFKCSSTPVCSFTNLSATILNSSYVFQGSYTQVENIPIKSWQMILYNSYDEIIGTSPITYSSIIEYEFAGFSNERGYKIELQAYSQDNLLGTTGKIPFHVRYEVPKTALALQATKIEELAATRLQWNVVQIIGKSDSSTFVSNEKIDVRNNKKVYFDKGFNISNNFTLKLWIESVTNYNFNILPSTQIVSYNVPLSDTTLIWLENSSQSTQLPMQVVVSREAPPTSNFLWIEDINFATPKTLSILTDIYAPANTNNLWIDLLGGMEENLKILKMQNNNGEFISLLYFNNKFYLYKNNELVTSLSISSGKYYLYIQQINDTLTFHAESIA